MWRQAQPIYIYVLVHPLLLQKANVSHIIRVESKSISYHAFPFSFLYPCSYLEDREKESNQSEPEIKRPIWNWLPGTFAWLLTEPCSQVLIFKCSDGPCKCKGLRTTSVYAKRLKQKVQRRAGTDHYSTMPFLQNRIIQTEEPRSNPSSASTTLSTAKVSHIIKVERTPDLTGLFWPSNSWVNSLLWRNQKTLQHSSRINLWKVNKHDKTMCRFVGHSVESKSISYRLSSLSFSLSSLLNERQVEGEWSTRLEDKRLN